MLEYLIISFSLAVIAATIIVGILFTFGEPRNDYSGYEKCMSVVGSTEYCYDKHLD